MRGLRRNSVRAECCEVVKTTNRNETNDRVLLKRDHIPTGRGSDYGLERNHSQGTSKMNFKE